MKVISGTSGGDFFPPLVVVIQRVRGSEKEKPKLEGRKTVTLLSCSNKMKEKKKRSEGLKSWSWDLLFRSDPEKTLV